MKRDEVKKEMLDNLIKETMEREFNSLQINTSVNKGLFNVKNANQWLEFAKSKPVPEMLFNEFWHEGEVCILFADSNLGKSILAVQIADYISKGKAENGFYLSAPKQNVLYFDFELSEKQFENRYSTEYEDHYKFDNNFIRVEINRDAEAPNHLKFEELLRLEIEKLIIESNCKVLIIDNLTFLKDEVENAKNASPLMKELKALKVKYDLSILILAHTPKRDSSKPITRNDVAGSKMLMNFCDSAFAIGGSSVSNNYRYIKQIKQRFTEEIYGSDNVCVCEIIKENSYLHFELKSFGYEREHLKCKASDSKDEDREFLIAETKRLKNDGLTQRQIAEELGISLGAVNKYLKL